MQSRVRSGCASSRLRWATASAVTRAQSLCVTDIVPLLRESQWRDAFHRSCDGFQKCVGGHCRTSFDSATFGGEEEVVLDLGLLQVRKMYLSVRVIGL